MKCSDASQCLRKPRERSSNVYIPPPARKLFDQEHGTVERAVSTRSRIYDETKACNDSSLLFLNDNDRLYSDQKSHRNRQKFKKQNQSKYSQEKIPQQEIYEVDVNTKSSYTKNQDNTRNSNVSYEIVNTKNITANCKGDESNEKENKLWDNDCSLQSSASSCCVTDDESHDEIHNGENDTVNDIENEGKLKKFSKGLLVELANLQEDELISDHEATQYSKSLSIQDQKEANIKKKKEIVYNNVEPSASKSKHVLSNEEIHKTQNVRNFFLVDKSSLLEHTQSSQTTCKENLIIEENDWEALYDEAGHCLADDKTHKSDCKKREKKRISPDTGEVLDEFQPKEEHSTSILEIYGFSPELKTQDLMTLLSAYTVRGLKLIWVDDTHALAIFPSPQLADEVLGSDLPIIRTRPLSQATTASQEKARNLVLPSTLRPKTCPAMARRLVTGALGLRVYISPEARAAEMELLRKAKEEKKLAAKQRDAAWEGVFE